MSNQTGFRQGRLGIGKNPIFPLDISGSTRIEGDLILGGTIADINGTPIEFGASSATLNVGTNMPIPEMTVSQVPSWSNNVTVEGAGKFVDAATAGDIYYNGGNIGIGTTSPDGPLDIEGNTNGGVRTFHKNLSTGTSSHVEKVFKAGDNELRLGVSADSYSDGNWDNGWVYSAHKNLKLTTPYNIIFCAGGASTQRMIINSSGNVGIGTTSPGEKLEVNGNIEISGSGSFRGGSVNSSTNVGVHLGSFSSAYGHIQIVSSNDNGGWIDFIKSDSGNADFRGRIRYGTGSSTPGMRFYTETSERMIIDNTGNVGIGTTSPGSQCKLQVYETGTEQAWKGRGVFGNETCAFVCGVYHNKIQIGGHNGALNAWYDIAINPGGGKVGIGTTTMTTTFNVSGSFYLSGYQSIGTTSIIYPLWVASRSGNPAQGGDKGAGKYFTASGGLYSLGAWGVEYSNGYPSGGISTSDAGKTSIRADGIIWSDIAVAVSSDSRIKKNIVDVPDQQALEMVRNIPCRYYEYIDNTFIKREGKTIGFIAQEVKDILPMAVNQETRFIPDVMKMLSVDNENIIDWTEHVDNSNNKIFKMKYDELGNVNNIEYKFYVADVSNNSSLEKIIIGNEDNTFTFEQKWNYVFCYGRKVDDFHTLDKQKLFALNFSATQELDRKVIALENENAELKAELAAIKQHLGI